MENVNSYPLLYDSKTSKRINTNTILVIISGESCSGLDSYRAGRAKVRNKLAIGNGQLAKINVEPCQLQIVYCLLINSHLVSRRPLIHLAASKTVLPHQGVPG
jgi:hypothetical protein